MYREGGERQTRSAIAARLAAVRRAPQAAGDEHPVEPAAALGVLHRNAGTASRGSGRATSTSKPVARFGCEYSWTRKSSAS